MEEELIPVFEDMIQVIFCLFVKSFPHIVLGCRSSPDGSYQTFGSFFKKIARTL